MEGIEDGRHEWRVVPDGVRAEAPHHPGGSVAAIDGSTVPDPNGYVPPEAIVGGYLVSESGEATGGPVDSARSGIGAARFATHVGWLIGRAARPG